MAAQGNSTGQQGFSQSEGPYQVHPSILRVLSDSQGEGAELGLSRSTRQSFKSLDRSLKAFLRSSNLPGLEYRLRLAGYNTLSDLLNADETTLCAHGFTPLMARRLLGALTDYIVRQLDKSEGVQLPFQLVRKGQKIKSDPTEKMKALPTFGKQNVKRHRYLEPPKMGKKRTGGLSKGGGKATNQKRPVSYLRLMSEEHLPNEPIFPNDVVVTEEAFAGTEDQSVRPHSAGEAPSLGEDAVFPPAAGSETALAGGGSSLEARESLTQSAAPGSETGSSRGVSTQESPFNPLPTQESPFNPLPTQESPSVAVPSSVGARASVRRSIPVFQEFFFPDQIDGVGERWLNSEEMGRRLKRCNSVPADYRFHGGPSSVPLQSWCMLVRSYSCPASLAVSPSQIESTLIKLTTSQELPVIVGSLEELCRACRTSEGVRREVRERGGLEILVDLLVSLCTHLRVVECCFKLIKYLTRDSVLEGVVPAETVPVVLQGMECHPFSEKLLSQGCLALGNIGRAAPSQCEQLLSDRTLTILAQVMGTFPSCLPLQVSALSTLAVGLGCCPEGRLSLLEEHGRLLDLVLTSMRSYPQHAQLQEYACSFMALLMAEVAVEMESGVVQLMVEHVCIAMATHSREAPVALWAAKALANASTNAALSDSKLAGRCCDLLAEALRLFPEDPQVWTWGMYALLRLTSGNSATRGDLVRGGVVSLLKTPPLDLPDFGVQYLEELMTTLIV